MAACFILILMHANGLVLLNTPIPATPTPPPAAFPATTLLDDFNRADGPVGVMTVYGLQLQRLLGLRAMPFVMG